MTEMRAFREYAINGREHYWKYVRPDGLGTDSVQKWTLTLHEPFCRYAKVYDDGRTKQEYFRGEEGLGVLSRNGFGLGERYRSMVWQGCKVCGTVHKEPEFMALADTELAQRRDDQIEQAVRDRAKWAREDAVKAKDLYIKGAQEAYYAVHFANQVDVAMARVAEEAVLKWLQEFPEQAALLPEEA